MIAIIPARGGSKGVPKKNIRPLAGKPLIIWTIEAAKKSTHIDRIILSTDDEEIVSVCQGTGIEIPFMRPKDLAQDDSSAIDNYIYTMDCIIKEHRYDSDEFIVLLPTTPLRNSGDIDAAVDIFVEKHADSVISCTQMSHPIDWVCNIDNEGRVLRNKMLEVGKTMNRQDLESVYIPNGGVFVLSYSLLRVNYSYYSDRTYAYIMPAERSVDIDTEFDFQFAEFLMNRGKENA